MLLVAKTVCKMPRPTDDEAMEFDFYRFLVRHIGRLAIIRLQFRPEIVSAP